jgi:SAM-dependent methyltransferase
MDAHEHEWMRSEMADVWLGFERPQVREWLEAAGLVNTIVDSTGETCYAESKDVTTPAKQSAAQVSVFAAVGTKRLSGAQAAVQEHYGAIAEKGGSCCSPETSQSSSCCGGNSDQLISLDDLSGKENALHIGYTPQEIAEIPAEATEISLGCGNPTAFAAMQPGQVVLDIGSGGGLDSFLSAGRVGAEGRVIGVDMTPAMLERARAAAERAGIRNVEFRQGQAESLPVEDEEVDVILSNCVINLTEDKGQVFREAFRVLKPGGRLEVSDVVAGGGLPIEARENASGWAECVTGALPEKEYLDLIAQAGFRDVSVRRSPASGTVAGVPIYSAIVSEKKKA